MGIKDLLPFIIDNFPTAVGQFKIQELKGCRIAIDAASWMYANRSTVQNKIIRGSLELEPDKSLIVREWIRACLNFCCMWLHHGINPIFCFEGADCLKEKIKTREKRGKKRRDLQSKIDEAKKAIIASNTDPLKRDETSVAQYKKYLMQLITITAGEIDMLKTCLRSVGIVCLTAKADGEKLCSMLCREGKVRAVFSADTDNIVYGCPLLITSIIHIEEKTKDGKEKIKMGYGVCYDNLVQELHKIGWTQQRFLDLCIAAGCDYNESMPGVLIKTAFKLLKQYSSLEEVGQKTGYDTKVLDYPRCREIFTPEPSSDVIVEGNIGDLQPVVSGARGILDQYGVGEYAGIFSYFPRTQEKKKPKLVMTS